MPELPEVETIRRDLERKIINKKIIDFYVSDTKVLQGLGREEFAMRMRGSVIKRIERRGKMLISKLDSGYYLLIHLKMTGQLVYMTDKETVAGGHETKEIGKLPNKHTRVIIEFENGSKLFFNDQRRFGYLKMVDDDELKRLVQYFGLEPLSEDFSFAKFKQLFRNKTTNIKNFLLNQKYIAGIGNIYADEICFEARIRPDRKVKTLSEAEVRRTYAAVKRILTRAVEFRGTTFANYVDGSGRKGNYSSQLKVYAQAGRPCFRCKSGIIEKMKISQRGTCYCPICQN